MKRFFFFDRLLLGGLWGRNLLYGGPSFVFIPLPSSNVVINRSSLQTKNLLVAIESSSSGTILSHDNQAPRMFEVEP